MSDPKEIINYLKNNPDFLTENPEVVEYLLPPKNTENGRKVADFRYYMVEKARAEKEKALADTQAVVEISRANMNNLDRIHAVTLKLLEAHSFGEFIDVITNDLAAMLDVDIVALVVEATSNDINTFLKTAIRLVPPGSINSWMGDKNIWLQSEIAGLDDIYGGAAPLVASQAVLRVDIAKNTPPALLAFGSRNPNLFIEGQATDNVVFLTRVVERLFRAWLDIPQT